MTATRYARRRGLQGGTAEGIWEDSRLSGEGQG